MRKLTFAVASCVVMTLAGSTLLMARPIPTDERITTGTLDNGLKWMFRKHDNPPGKMAMMICVDTGSLNEKESQRGLAHFMEHMVFNGSENFAPGELIPYFESIGMEFGPDLNAMTGFDETRYLVFIPTTETEQLDKGLMVLSDYVFRGLLLEQEIDKERGVIMAEKRAGKGARQRLRDEVWPQLFEGSRIAQRMIIGADEVIEHAPRAEFVDFYRTWYRPERMTLLLIGDTELEPIMPSIRKWFGQYRPNLPAREARRTEIKNFTEQRAIVATDAELTTATVQMYRALPGRPPTITTEQARVDIIEAIGSRIVGRRLEQRQQRGEATYRSAAASVFSFYRDNRLAYASAIGEPDVWNKLLDEIVEEVARARDHGFTQRELDLAKKEIFAGAERGVRTEPTQDGRRMLFAYSRAVNDTEPITSAQQDLDLLSELLPTIQLTEVSKAFAENFKQGTFAYILEMPRKEGLAVPASDEVLAAARAAIARKTEPPASEDRPSEFLTALPEPGKVVESVADEDLDITSAWLDNGTRVHHRFMDYKKDSVWVSIALAGGRIEETAANAGITSVAALAVNQPSTSRLTSNDVADLLTGTNIGVRASVGADSLTISIAGSPRDLETGLQLAHALLTDGRIEESAFDTWTQSSLQSLRRQEFVPAARSSRKLQEIRGGGDPRLTAMTVEKVKAQNISAAQKWFERLCAEAPIEVAVVGEINLDDATKLINRYIGSLSKRPRKAAHLEALRKVGRKPGPYKERISVDTMTPKGDVFCGFMSCDTADLLSRRALSLAVQTLDSRMTKQIREEKQLVYSIQVQNAPASTFQDTGVLLAGAPCDPDRADEMVTESWAIFDAFAKTGPTTEELANAKKQQANNLDTRLKEPRYWWSVLRHLELRGRSLEEQKNVIEYYDKLTAEQVRDAFRKYYTDPRKFTIVAVPIQKVPPATEEPPATQEKPETPTPASTGG